MVPDDKLPPLRLMFDRGERLGLVWYEQNRGHHMVLAPSERALITMWLAVLNKEQYAEPRALYRLRFGVPWPRYVQAMRRVLRQQAIDDFKLHVRCLVLDVWGQPHKHSNECQQTVRNAFGDAPSKNRFRMEPDDVPAPSGWTWEDLYAVRGALVEPGSRRTEREKLPTVKPDAPVLRGKIWRLLGDFGHHHAGILFDDLPDNPRHAIETIAFCERAKLPIPATVTDAAAEIEARQAAERKRWEARRREQDAAVYRAQDVTLLKLLE